MAKNYRIRIVEPPHQLTAETKEDFYNTVKAVVTTQAECILVNLQLVNLIDSSGLGVLFGAFKLATCAGSNLVLCSPQNHVMRDLDVTGLNKIVTIYETLHAFIEDLTRMAHRPSSNGSLKLPDFR